MKASSRFRLFFVLITAASIVIIAFKAWALTQLTVNVKHNGVNLEGVTVHLEPRESGLEPVPGDDVTDASGNAYFADCKSGRYDIELTHPIHGQNVYLNRNVSGTLDTENTEI